MHKTDHRIKIVTRFFYVALSYTTLEAYYKTLFAMVQHHKYSISEIDNMIPYERDIIVEMLIQYLKDAEQKRNQQNG